MVSCWPRPFQVWAWPKDRKLLPSSFMSTSSLPLSMCPSVPSWWERRNLWVLLFFVPLFYKKGTLSWPHLYINMLWMVVFYRITLWDNTIMVLCDCMKIRGGIGNQVIIMINVTLFLLSLQTVPEWRLWFSNSHNVTMLKTGPHTYTKFCENPSSRFCVILLTNRRGKHNLIGGGDKKHL